MTFHLLDHPNPTGPNYYPTRNTCKHGLKKPHLIVVHTAENLPDWTPPDQGAENVARYASTTTRNVSWHSTVDSDTIIPMLPDDYTAWHASSFNRCSLGVEIATQAGRWIGSPWDWREKILVNTARVVAQWCHLHQIPAKQIDRVAADAGLAGIVSHAALDPERRTDPGSAFPWSWFVAKVVELKPRGPNVGTPVMGQPQATVEQALQWAGDRAALKRSPYSPDTIRAIVRTYWKVGTEYGVRPDLALAQSAKETGFWAYRKPDGSDSDVRPHQWNFAGIGATGGVPGISYPNIETGVRSHVLRMRMYAVNDPAAYNVDVLVRTLPSSHWGRYPTIEDFNGVWAVPGIGYGQSVVKNYLNPMVAQFVADPVAPLPTPPLSDTEIVNLRTMLTEWRGAG